MLNPFTVTSPWAMADRLLHELEDEVRLALPSDEEDTAAIAAGQGRLWAVRPFAPAAATVPLLTRPCLQAVDVVETPNAFKLSTDVPGLAKSDIHVILEDNVLKLSGERKRETTSEGDGWKRQERSYGMFERRFRSAPLPAPSSRRCARL
jgi:hypothetical protein